jgi:hypothetical protein
VKVVPGLGLDMDSRSVMLGMGIRMRIVIDFASLILVFVDIEFRSI